jgi:predicted O-methyltransferase YrrM
VKRLFKLWSKRLQFLTPLRRSMVHRYDYFFWPVELAFLCELLEQGIKDGGIALEVGCAQGASTVFLNNHLTWAQRYHGLRADEGYVCLDTFSGFTSEHANYEQQHRGKAGVSYDAYQINSPKWFEYMLGLNNVKRVSVHQGDAAAFDYTTLGQIGFALLDVDLYLPTKAALPRVFAQLQSGGVIVVDDCAPAQVYDGARQAYLEFLATLGREPEIHHRKFGIIRK